VALSGTTHTLTVREASPGSGTENLQDGMYRVIKFTGALGGNNTVTIAPNTAPAYFIFENATTDSGSSGPYSVILTQGSGANITIQNGKNAIVYCDGAGSGAAVVNALSDLQIATLEVTGAAAIDGALTAAAITGTTLTTSGIVSVDDTTTSTSGTTGSIHTDGGLGVAGTAFVAGAATVGGASQFNSTVTVGVNDTGYDVKLFGATSGKSLLWDESADSLIVTGTTTLVGTTNLDAVDIDGATQIDGTVTVGVNDTGYDVKFFGATSGSYMLWDESTDDLILGGAAKLGIGTTAPAVELDVNGIAGWGGGTTGQTAQIVGANSPLGNGGNLRVLSNTTQATNIGGSLVLGGYYTAQTNSIGFGEIGGRKENATAGNTAGYLAFGTRPNGGNMTERMRITTAGTVGIGTGAIESGFKLHVVGDGFFSQTSGTVGKVVVDISDQRLLLGSYYEGGVGQYSFISSTNNAESGNEPLAFRTGTTERMRIDVSGNLLVGTISLNGGTGGITNNLAIATTRNTGATAGKFWKFPYVDTNNSCYIINNSNTGAYIADGDTSWTENSDERLKDIIEPIVNAAEKVSSLRTVIGKFKTDEEGKRRSFLIAQDVQAVLPEAVTASKLPNSEDDTEYLGINYTQVIPLLVAAIKELSDQNIALTNRITALEG